ncbi:transcriptional activator of glycolytic enzymes-domain-containing protein [Hypoxylon cercidicola]|nr:transcriptional activator of glycolytic enzymes-domain-containing protein [Hypoxylon cercidicola]
MLPSPSAGLSNVPPPSAAATGPTIGTSTATSATPVPGPGPAATGATLKRPAAADLQRSAGTSATPSKRQATSGTRANPIPNPSPLAAAGPASSSSASVPPTTTATQPYLPPQVAMSLPAVVTEEQLLGRTPEQLIATILQIQMQHQQYVAHISAQFDTISQQLNELRGSLVASHQAAASALSSRESSMRPIIPPPQQPAASYSRGLPMSIQTPSRPARPPPASPSTSSQAIQPRPVQTPQSAGPPQYKYGTVGTVEEVWKEYREGMDGQPAIEDLDATWGSRWRPEPRGRTWYSRRKVIWDKIKDYMTEGLDEDEAVREVEKLRDGGTINKLIRMLQDERKEKGIGDDSMTT